MEKMLNSTRLCCTLVMLMFVRPVLAWDTAPQSFNAWTHWSSPRVGFSSANSFVYTDDGTSKLRLSTIAPTEGSTSGNEMKTNQWTYLDGKVVIRTRDEKNINGKKSVQFDIGGVGAENQSGLHKGTFYVWYGKNAMATLSYEMYYLPHPIVTAPTEVIDLGICHKSVKGDILSKAVNIDAKILGYLNNSSYGLTRTINFGHLPVGADFIDSSGQAISNGKAISLDASISEPPFTISDTFNARLNCDQASIGVQSWTANVVYTIQ